MTRNIPALNTAKDKFTIGDRVQGVHRGCHATGKVVGFSSLFPTDVKIQLDAYSSPSNFPMDQWEKIP